MLSLQGARSKCLKMLELQLTKAGVHVSMNGIELGLFANRIAAICDEMGAILRRAAFSPNIKDRLDFSCAVFDRSGGLCAQAAHIPVHLGSMAYAMADVVGGVEWAPGDMMILNDPFLGGTHLPDVTVIAPVFVDQTLVAFVVNRAHHADIGSDAPGSMPLSTDLAQEGLLIPPMKLHNRGEADPVVLGMLGQLDSAAVVGGSGLHGDFAAQVSANLTGLKRAIALIEESGGVKAFNQALVELNNYAEQLSRSALSDLPVGRWCASALMDDDGAGTQDIEIQVTVSVDESGVAVDFAGTSAQVAGNINCPLPVTAAAVYYAVRCLLPDEAPQCGGTFRPITIAAPEGSLVNARRPAAVAAGNVETSMRIVDAIFAALAQPLPDRIPAASQGSMNNLAMGVLGGWHYYETMAGGAGAACGQNGAHAVHSHMTNTLNTPVESLETHYPLRIVRYAIRHGSGGDGEFKGGDGVVREFEFLEPTAVTLITERRRHRPPGAHSGGDGMAGQNHLNGALLAPKCSLKVATGDRISVATPGGGGWGKP